MNTEMKIGDKVGISYTADGVVSLYCYISQITEKGVKLYVINGNWDLTMLHNKGGIIHHPRGDVFDIQMRVRFTGDIPSEIVSDYNAAIDYMNSTDLL